MATHVHIGHRASLRSLYNYLSPSVFTCSSSQQKNLSDLCLCVSTQWVARCENLIVFVLVEFTQKQPKDNLRECSEHMLQYQGTCFIEFSDYLIPLMMNGQLVS